jgi:hypothetical protein
VPRNRESVLQTNIAGGFPLTQRSANKRCHQTSASIEAQLAEALFPVAFRDRSLFVVRDSQFVNHIRLNMARQGAGFTQDCTVGGRPARCSANRNGCGSGGAPASPQIVCS